MLHLIALLASQCGASCAVPPVSSVTSVPLDAVVEVVSASTGALVHRAFGPVVDGRKVHLGGKDLRGLGFDLPDYEVNTRMITQEKAWTST